MKSTGNKQHDMLPLAKGLEMPFDFGATRYALNRLVVGPTGSGKTWSTLVPELLHTNKSSLFVPVMKKEIIDRFSENFREKGYRREVIDLCHPEKSTVIYDPMYYVHDEKDSRNLARNIIESKSSKTMEVNSVDDPYWNQAAEKVVFAYVEYARICAADKGSEATLSDVLKLHKNLRVWETSGKCGTSLDTDFQNLEIKHHGNPASQAWKTIQGLAFRTSSCILSIVNAKMESLGIEGNVMRDKPIIDFSDLGKEKTVVFLYLPAFDRSCDKYVTLLYSDLMKCLFEAAQEEPSGSLPVHTDIIFDDFACSRIPQFEDYISVMRAANISASLLIQDDSQLENMYGKYAADTIRNNCPTYIYFGGGNDLATAESVARRLNVSVRQVLEMPIGNLAVFRPGAKPFTGERYPVYEDRIYKEIYGNGDLSR